MMAAAAGGFSWTWVVVAVFACAFFLQAAVHGQPQDPILSDPNVIPINISPYEKQPTVVSCYDQSNQKPTCSIVARQCPPGCSDACYVHCPSCKIVCLCDLTGTGCHDPRFVGGDGNAFLFHGYKDADFCLLSDSNLHINAHFIGKRNTGAARDFTWVQALGIRFDNHRLHLGVKKTVTWDNSVDRLEITFDGEPVYLEGKADAKWRSFSTPALSITRTSVANGVAVQLDGKFRIVANALPVTEKDSEIHNYGLTSEDSLAHLNVAFKFYSLTANVHGVLGQTYRPDYVSTGMDVGAKVPVMRGARKYSSSDIFTTDCAVARFTGQKDRSKGVEMITEPSDALCASGEGGAGLVCKK